MTWGMLAMGIKKDGDYGTMHRILKILAWRYSTSSELAQMLGMTRQALYYHLSRLKEWGFVIEHTRECILAVCIDYTFENCDVVEGDKIIGPLNCKEAGRGGYYIYASNYYIRKYFPARSAPSFRNPPQAFIGLVKRRLERLGILGEVKGYDLILMAGILHLMAAVLWNPKPRGDSYWVRLKHLTARGIQRKIPEYLYWYTHKRIRFQAGGEAAIRKYEPSLRKIRWILARMHDYMMVERLGGGHCPYGVWVPHPSLFTPDGKPDFHLPPHRHVKAKHRYRTLNVKRSFTQ